MGTPDAHLFFTSARARWTPFPKFFRILFLVIIDVSLLKTSGSFHSFCTRNEEDRHTSAWPCNYGCCNPVINL